MGGQRELPPIRYYVRITIAVVATLALALALYRVRSTLLLIFLGLFVAVGIEPTVARLERRGVRRGWTIIGIVLLLLAGLLALVMLVLVPAASQVAALVQSIPSLVTSLAEHIHGTALGDYLEKSDVQAQIQNAGRSLLLSSTGSIGSIFGIIGGLLGAVFTALTVAALSIYFSLAMPRLRTASGRVLGSPDRVAALDEALAKVGSYVSGQLVICLCAGITSYVALLIIGVPYAAVLAIIVTVLDAIPQVGATLAAAVAVLIAFTVSVPVGLVTLSFFLIYQQAENYLIAPRVFASAIGMSPLATFVAILVGASLGGVVGAVVALPVTAAGTVLVRHLARPDRGIPEPPATDGVGSAGAEPG